MPKNIKFLLDENLGYKIAIFLRDKEFDVKSVLEDYRGISDTKVLQIANKEKRIIITLDKDFCALIFRDLLPCEGLILLRLKNEFPENIIKVLEQALKANQNFQKKFVVISDNKIRIRQLID